MGGADDTNDKITIQNDGTYELNVKITPSSDLTGLDVYFQRNGIDIERELNSRNISSFETIEFGLKEVLTSGDEITVLVDGETSDGSDWSLAPNVVNSEFSVARLG